MQQLAAFPTENCLKYAVSCAKRGGNLASYTETTQPLTFDATAVPEYYPAGTKRRQHVILWVDRGIFSSTDKMVLRVLANNPRH